jgi:hypothetical protein
MQLMYPEPTILSKHTLVSLTPAGAALGEFLTDDPELQSLATEYGFRTNDPASFQTFLTANDVDAPSTLLDVIDPPTYERLEAMITRPEQLYGAGSVTLPSPSGGTAP